MSVSLSAGGAGSRPADSSLERMKASTGDRTQSLRLTLGTGGSATGWNDQNFRASVKLMRDFDATGGAVSTRGSGAPIRIQDAKSAICSSGSLPEGDIFSSW